MLLAWNIFKGERPKEVLLRWRLFCLRHGKKRDVIIYGYGSDCKRRWWVFCLPYRSFVIRDKCIVMGVSSFISSYALKHLRSHFDVIGKFSFGLPMKHFWLIINSHASFKNRTKGWIKTRSVTHPKIGRIVQWLTYYVL